MKNKDEYFANAILANIEANEEHYKNYFKNGGKPIDVPPLATTRPKLRKIIK